MHFGLESVTTLAICVTSLAAHECSHAGVALLHGDPTARERGRLSINPLRHLDLWGSVVVPLLLIVSASPLVFAWARPVPVEGARLRHPRRDVVRVALAGPLANLLLAIGFAAAARALPEAGRWAQLRPLAVAGVAWNCGIMLFNLVPIPPLDGSWVLKHFLRLRHIVALHHFRFAALALTFAMVALPPSRWVFEASFQRAVGTCLGLFGLSATGMRH